MHTFLGDLWGLAGFFFPELMRQNACGPERFRVSVQLGVGRPADVERRSST